MSPVVESSDAPVELEVSVLEDVVAPVVELSSLGPVGLELVDGPPPLVVGSAVSPDVVALIGDAVVPDDEDVLASVVPAAGVLSD